LAEQLAELEAIHLVAGESNDQSIVTSTTEAVEVIVTTTDQSANELGTAEDLLAELMRTAESEADLVTSVLVESSPSIEQSVYTVRSGDTLWKIADQHGMTLEQLRAVNTMSDTNKLLVGQTLIISQAPVVASPTPSLSDNNGTLEWYVVRPGDSLYGIGRKFESSVADLLAWNHLANADTLQIGQKLRLFPEQ